MSLWAAMMRKVLSSTSRTNSREKWAPKCDPQPICLMRSGKNRKHVRNHLAFMGVANVAAVRFLRGRCSLVRGNPTRNGHSAAP
jgi:hypothetical protein